MTHFHETLCWSAVAALLLGSPAVAQGTRGLLPSWALKAWNETDGPAAASIFEYAKRTIIRCYERDRESRCSLASRTGSVGVFYSAPYNAQEYAFVVIYFHPDTGNALWFDASIFRRGLNAKYARFKEIKGLVGEVENAKLQPDRFIVTTSTLTPDDARCCPSGRTVWSVGITDGVAKYESGYKSPSSGLAK